MLEKIQKRDGRIVRFEQKKITDAILRALFEARIKDGKKAKKLSDEVVEQLEKRFAVPTVEDAQNVVEEVLSKFNKKVAKLYGEFREKKAEIRKTREELGVKEKLSYNAMTVLEKRYLLRNETGKIIESPADMFRRVAKTVAVADEKYGGNARKTEEEFYKVMSKFEFLPNSPTLFNAGTPMGQLSACFVLPVEDSLESIFSAVKELALISQTGGGVGFSFSRLRPEGDVVKSTMGVASGPVSFMRVFDTATDVIKQGGRRRGAMMGILRVDHPDILKFVNAKIKEGALTNFNISVAVTDTFMNAVRRNQKYPLINPRTRKISDWLDAKYVWDLIIKNAWKTGDPGVFFIDEANRRNPTPHLGKIESTNPCAEAILYPYESCNLGSINLSKAVEGKKIKWEKLGKTVHTAIHFLDNVIDVNKYPLPQIDKMTKANRKIGLGVMGFADMLIQLGIPYNSEEAIAVAEKVMKFISEEARKASQELAKNRGSFPNFKGSIWEKAGYREMRNAALTAIAPTGTISIIAGCSSGIEPLFAVSFVRNVLEGKKLLEVNHAFESIAKEAGFYSAELMVKIAEKGPVQGIKEIPQKIRRLFVTALEIKPEWHVRMQAVFQKYVDNSVSKTINFPPNAKINDVKKTYELAHKLKCKGITIYRYGSKKEQVLYVGKPYVLAESEYAGGCPTRMCPVPG
jgi:ribonucleoside-diphosphate reductase alpha chain